MRTLIILSSAAAIVAAAIALPTVPAMASNQTVTVNFASTTGAANGVGSGFLYGLSQDGTGPDDGLLASLAPTSGRGGGARLAGGGWIGDGYTDGNWHFSGTPVADAATVNGDLSADASPA